MYLFIYCVTVAYSSNQREATDRCRHRRRSARDWRGRHRDSSATTSSSCRRCCRRRRHIWSTDLFPASSTSPLSHHRNTSAAVRLKSLIAAADEASADVLRCSHSQPLRHTATFARRRPDGYCEAAAATHRGLYMPRRTTERARARARPPARHVSN